MWLIKKHNKGCWKVYRKKKIVSIFQPHRISRLKNLKLEFSKCFKNSDVVILCPIYKAGDNIKLGFTYDTFARLIIKNSKVSLIKVNDQLELKKLIMM